MTPAMKKSKASVPRILGKYCMGWQLLSCDYSLLQLYHCNTNATFSMCTEAEGFDVAVLAEELLDTCAEGACSFAVDERNLFIAGEDGIV